MSGGAFDYDQYKIRNIADSIESEIERSGRPLTDEEFREKVRWYGVEYFERYPDERTHHKYPDEVIKKFRDAVKILRIAEIYAQRVDWLLSGDDGEETFLKRLSDELNKLDYSIVIKDDPKK